MQAQKQLVWSVSFSILGDAWQRLEAGDNDSPFYDVKSGTNFFATLEAAGKAVQKLLSSSYRHVRIVPLFVDVGD